MSTATAGITLDPVKVEQAIGLIGLAADIGTSLTGGKVKVGFTVAEGVVQLVQMAAQIYEKETGEPLDESKIRPYVPLPEVGGEAV